MQDTFWTDELVKEFVQFTLNKTTSLSFDLEQFKSSKSPKKEWEIVAYQEMFTKSVVASPSCVEWSAAEKGHKNYTIHSVRRLSDGEVFSVGDRIKNHSLPIARIVIDNGWTGGIRLECPHENEARGIKDAEKLPAPLLTTVDGVEVFDLDNFRPTVVFDDWSTNINADRSLWETGVNHYGGKLFSSNEVAQQYILDNKPVLSLKDVKKVLDSIQFAHDNTGPYILEVLTNTVKQKLNQ